jgi:hypothetical protein
MTCKATENTKSNCFNLLSRFWDLPLFSFRSADRLFYGLLAFPSASGSWQKEEGWLLLCDLVEADVDGEEICWSDRRLQLSSLLSPAAAGAAVEMGEVAGSVEAEERMVSSPGGSSGG